MKRTLFTLVLILALVSIPYLPNIFAQDYTQLSLPEGAKARLGKGTISGNIAYSADGTRLAVAGSIGIWIYDAETGAELDLLTGHTSAGSSVAFSPDGNTIASGGYDKLIHLWDANTGRHLRTLVGHNGVVTSMSFSRDSIMLASGSRDNTIRLWDVNTGKHLRTFTSQAYGRLQSVAFSPDGQTLASCYRGTRVKGPGLRDKQLIHLWNVTSGELKWALTGYTFAINCVAFSPDGRTLVSGNYDNTVRLWDAKTGRPLRTFAGHTDSVNSVLFSPDGQTLASGSDDGTIHLWDARTGAYLRTPPVNRTSVGLWSTSRGLFRSQFEDAYPVSSVVFSPDGQTLASGSDDNTIRLWNARTGTHLRTLTKHVGAVSSVAFFPDGQRLVSASYDDRTISLWDVRTGAHLHTLTGHTDWVSSVAFSPDGQRLASGSDDRTIRLWEVNRGTHLRTLTGHTDWVANVAFSPDGQRLASVSRDDTVLLWDVETGRHLHTLTGHTDWVSSVAFSPDGNTLASRSGDETRLSDVETGRHLHTLTGHTSFVESISFSPDGSILASGGRDWTIRLWDATTGGHLRTLTGHTSWVNSVSFSPDGNTLASGSDDGTVLLWGLDPIPTQLPEDVNDDGVVNIIDLTLVASNFGETGQNAADVNGDGVVNIIDLTLVAAAFGNTASAPLALGRASESAPTRADVEAWLREARQMNLTDPTFQRGLAVLEQLLAAFTPKETILLPNYPNPFNPETWIPYQLATPADVSISIYAADGKLVRRLELGHQPVGIYESRSRAAYWDGKNTLGEPVASGVYFYTLTAGDFTATRKMLIRTGLTQNS